MTDKGGAFIANDWREGQGALLPAPYEGGAGLRGATADDVAEAFAAAREAFPGWARTPLAERVDSLNRFKAILEARKADLARLISEETGKPLWEGEAEAGAMIGKIGLSIQAYDARTGETTLETAFGAARLSHRPHGVMLVLGPYNFPGHLPNGHIAPALLAGNTVVFKPSEFTPRTGAALVDALAATDLPSGVVNLVQGGREIGQAAVSDARVDGVLFTGSAAAGAAIHKAFGGRPEVILALEMVGNNPLLVWDAEDAQAAARLALHSAYVTAGQRCSCARRLIVAEGAAGDAVVEALAADIQTVQVGAWDAQPAPFIGRLINADAAERVLAAQADRLARGGRAIRLAQPLALGPAFLSPGLIDVTGVETPDEEVFGPLLHVLRTPSFEAGLEAANATRFGLAAGLISDDPGLWVRFQAEIRAGVVNWNRPTTGASSALPFGGPGASGNARPSAYYAADYCAWPMAMQTAERPQRLGGPGLAP
ncbi:MAG: succinylglutamate-semialdehyde dehydrogenase [Maricaulaceae bacterium]